MMQEEYGDFRSEGQPWPLEVAGGARIPRCLGVSKGSLLGVFLTILSSCAGVDDTSPPPPDGVMAFLGATQSRLFSPAPGLTYYGLVNSEEPWAAHLLRMELARCELGLAVLEAPLGDEADDGLSRVSELVRGSMEKILAAVNGDFFTPEGVPLGTEVAGGVPRRVRGRPALAWNPTAGTWMGTPTLDGDSVVLLGWSLPRAGGDGITQVVGGFPLLLLQGRPVGDLEVEERPAFASERHPRTAVGLDVDQNLLWVIVVDGRQPDHSAGMTLPELADLMEALGVEDAINLDGGGSSVMVVGDDVVSRPSDGEGERPVANAVGILRDPGLCRIREVDQPGSGIP